MTAIIFYFAFGTFILLVGADLLVRGAKGMALRLGIPMTVTGLTVVAIGTSAPEIAVTITAATSGKADLALGNVVGSNIANVMLVLGLCGTAAALTVDRGLLRFDIPTLIVTSFLVAVFASGYEITRMEGTILVVAAGLYIAAQVLRTRRTQLKETPPELFDSRPIKVLAAMIVGGLVALVWGSDLMVSSASAIATSLGMSELLIGLTVVAVGTSLPEIATSVVATIRGEVDIALGNVVGSNIINATLVLGLGAAITPVAVSPLALEFDIPVMLATGLCLLPLSWSHRRLARGEGIFLLLCYLAYLWIQVLLSSGSEPNMKVIHLCIYGITAAVTALAIYRRREKLRDWFAKRR